MTALAITGWALAALFILAVVTTASDVHRGLKNWE